MSSQAGATLDAIPPGLEPEARSRVRVTPARVFKSEWIKFRTLRSSWLLLLVAFGSLATIGIAVNWSTIADWAHMNAREFRHFNALDDSLVGFQLSQLAVGVLGILVIAGEYSTGMIRSSLSAVPNRLPILWAKTILVATLTLVVSLPASLITFFGSQRILSSHNLQTSWSAPNVPRTVLGVALYLTVVAVIGVALGALIRNIAGAIATFVGIMLVLPAIASSLPPTWADRINPFLPSTAGQALMAFRADTRVMLPWNGFVLFVVYAAALLGVAAFLLKRKDA